MVDKLTKEHRSWVMSRIRSRDTKPELIVRSMLHRCGYRFSLRKNDLPGKPDVVMPKHNTIIFIHGCFWHQHKNCKNARRPKENKSYWLPKLEANRNRDAENLKTLNELGWECLVVWECELKQEEKIKKVLGEYLKDTNEN